MKQLRQRAIRDLVETRGIRTQQELASALRDRGFRTTQATISRDVAELGLIKVPRDGVQAYALPPRLVEAEATGEERLRKLLRERLANWFARELSNLNPASRDLVLDSLEDPQNVGTLLRSAEAAGVHGLLERATDAGSGDLRRNGPRPTIFRRHLTAALHREARGAVLRSAPARAVALLGARYGHSRGLRTGGACLGSAVVGSTFYLERLRSPRGE